MIEIALYIGFGSFGLALVMNLVALVRGPDPADRILALDTMVINAIALIVLFGLRAGSQVYFEASMIFAMIGFVSTVAFTRFLLRGNIIE